MDVRGNISTLTAVVVTANPKRQAILFDREDVDVGAKQVLEVAKLVERCQIVGGNFFDSLPQGGAFYLLSRVLLNTE